MKIELYYIGKKSKNLYDKAEQEFIKRLGHYCRFEVIPIRPLKDGGRLPQSELLKKEADLFRSQIGTDCKLVLLDESGSNYSSKSFSNKISNWRMTSSRLVFLVGGAYGFDDSLKTPNVERVSLSKMTMPHHLARLVFLEQLYRAFTIINNESYHNN